MRQNTDQKNFEYGPFLGSVTFLCDRLRLFSTITLQLDLYCSFYINNISYAVKYSKHPHFADSKDSL